MSDQLSRAIAETESKQGPPLKLLKAVNMVMRDVSTVQKKGRNKEQGYAFMKGSDLIAELHGAMAEHDLVLLGSETAVEFFPLTSARGGSGERARVDMAYTLWHVDGESITLRGSGVGDDFPGDKALPKAKTGALKKVLQEMFLIEASDDPENPRMQQHAEDYGRSDQQRPPAKQNKPALSQVQQPEALQPPRDTSLTVGFNGGMGLKYRCEAAKIKGDPGKEYAVLKLVDAEGNFKGATMFKHFADVLADLGLPVQGADLMVEANKNYDTNNIVTVDAAISGDFLNIDRCEVENPSPRGAEYRDAKLASAAGVEAPAAAPAEAPPVEAKPASTGRPVPPQTPPAQTPQELAAASAPPVSAPAESPAVENAAEATAAGATASGSGDDADLPDFGLPLDMDYLPAMLYEIRRLAGLDSFDAARDKLYAQARVKLAEKNGVSNAAILQSDINAWLAEKQERLIERWKATDTHADFAAAIPFTLADATEYVSEGGMR